jgi:glycine/D-amino acid oxidase-like deaminating enzyme
MARVVVIGAGAMGLAAAYHAVRAGHEVEVIEAGAEPGGMAAHFDLDGLSIERFYHFICKTDAPTFALLGDLGIAVAQGADCDARHQVQIAVTVAVLQPYALAVNQHEGRAIVGVYHVFLFQFDGVHKLASVGRLEVVT